MLDSNRKYGHIPVLKEEAVDYLNLKSGDIVVDCTLGLGGHAEAILDKIGPGGRLIGIEQDEENLKIARERLRKYFDQTFLYHANFADLKEIVEKVGLGEIDAVLFDLGMASTHVDVPDKGFSFLKDGPLSLRFDSVKGPVECSLGEFHRAGKTAADLVNSLDEKELARIFFRFGEEKRASKIAKEIVKERKEKRILRTGQLAEIIQLVVRGKAWKHAAAKVFQALRIAVNDELNVLEKGLWSAIDILKKGGRVVVISYHSLEDRIVKNIFREAAKDCVCSPLMPKCQCGKKSELKIITSRPIIPGCSEIERNPRSRSAKMRVAEKKV